jgi:hypothetical protein
MRKVIVVVFIIVLVICTGVIGAAFFWTRLSSIPGNPLAVQVEKPKIQCTLKDRVIDENTSLVLKLDSGCSLCICGSDANLTCQLVECKEADIYE